MGYFERNKTKAMLRSKYWFPTMTMQENTETHPAILRMSGCRQTAYRGAYQTNNYCTRDHNCCEGPYPDGRHNLVAIIDKQTQDSDVEVT